jgi:hypothetical protein
MAVHSFNAYPEDRYGNIPMVKPTKYSGKLWLMCYTIPTSHHPQGGHFEIIRRPVEVIERKGFFRRPEKKIVWQRIDDDPKIPIEQVEEWAREAVNYINSNLDADFPREIKFSSVHRGSARITFETDLIPKY